MIGSLSHAGYVTRAFFLTRDWHATASSQVKHGHVKTYAQALSQIRRATAEIPSALQAAAVPWLAIHYEALGRREYIWRILESFGLIFEQDAPVFYCQDDKYYQAPAEVEA
jgi:hypothetical protein